VWSEGRSMSRVNLENGLLGGYRIHRYIGSGPLGQVYAVSSAEDRRPKASFALKRLRSEVVGGDQNRRMLQRAFDQTRDVADHSHIASSLDLFFDEGDVYLLSPLDTGESLETILWRARAQGYHLSPPDTLTLLAMGATALEALHAVGITHGDLKPSNMRAASNQTGSDPGLLDIRVSDYIFADLVTSQQSMRRQSDASIYAAPEQFDRNVSPSSDQYALAAILFRCLTGVTPFLPRSADAIIEQKRDASILALRAPELPAKTLAVLRRAMDMRPEARYPSLQEFSQELTAVLKQAEQDAGELLLRGGGVRRMGRRDMLIGLAATGATFLVTGLFHSRLADVGARLVNPAGSAVAQPAAAYDRTWIVKAHAVKTAALAWSPTGTRLATGGGDNTVRIWTPGAARPLATIQTASSLDAVAWSPNGEMIAFGEDAGFVRLANLEGRVVTSIDMRGGKAYGVVWSPDGSRLVGCAANGRVIVWDAKTLKEYYSLSGPQDQVRAVTFSPDGRVIAGACVDENVYVWNAHTGALVAQLPGSSGALYTVAFSPDGSLLAAAGVDTRLRMWRTDTYQVAMILPPENTASVRALSWSSDGRVLAAGSADGAIVLWDMDTITPEQVSIAAGDGMFCLAWKQRTRTLAAGFANGMLAVWQARGGSAV